MARRKESTSPQTVDDVLLRRIENLEAQLRIVNQVRMSSVQTVRIKTLLGASQGMIGIDWPTRSLCFYHDDKWICIPFPPTHAIKVFSDRENNKVLNGAFRFSVEPDLDGYDLLDVYAFNGTAGGGPTTVQISNETRGINFLSSLLTIPGGAYDSGISGLVDQGGPIDNPFRRVVEGDRIWINPTAVGGGSRGLGVYMTFARTEESVP